MTRFAILLLAILGLNACCTPDPAHPSKYYGEVERIQAEINQMMADSAVAWTANDLDGFMESFYNSPDLVFAIPTGITKGWQPLKERYAKSIAKSDLWFTKIEITVVTSDTALVFARFNNQVKDDKTTYSTGLTTLLVKKIDDNWVIVHDHSSGLPADYPQ